MRDLRGRSVPRRVNDLLRANRLKREPVHLVTVS
jgi:hypothetical protein